MNILFDTNILIDVWCYNQPMPTQISEMLHDIATLKYQIYVHSAQVDDYKRDKDDQRKAFNLSRLAQYNILEQPPIPTEEDVQNNNWKQTNDNDRIDNLLLFALQRDTVHLLVTEDHRIHKKAIISGIDDRVFYLEDFCAYLKQQLGTPYQLPAGISMVKVYSLERKAPFWDSLRNDYPNFDDWYKKICQEQREAWGVIKDNQPLALCVFKENEKPEILTTEEKQLTGKILKICTFKVSTTVQGMKYGERLLYTAFTYAHQNNYDWVYLHTAKDKQDHLKELCLDFGFQYFGERRIDNTHIDEVYVKEMKLHGAISSQLTSFEFAKKYYPLYRDGQNVQKFIVPIRPSYHNNLFPDIDDLRDSFLAPVLIPDQPQSNTIKKAYICKSRIKNIKSGDLLLFYRSNDRKNVQVIAVVEKSFFFNENTDFGSVQALVAKRTVYSKEELKQFHGTRGIVLLFRIMKFVNMNSGKTDLISAGIKGTIQSIRSITHEQYTILTGDK